MASSPPRRRRQQSPAVWRPVDVADDDGWIVELTDDHRREIAGTARQVTARGIDWSGLSAETFPLPGMR